MLTAAAILYVVIDHWNIKQRAIPGLLPADNLITEGNAQSKRIASIIFNTAKYLWQLE